MTGDDSTTEASSGTRARRIALVGIAALLAATIVARHRIGRDRVAERDAP